MRAGPSDPTAAESSLTQFLPQLADAALAVGPGGTITAANEAACVLSGYPSAALQALHTDALLTPVFGAPGPAHHDRMPWRALLQAQTGDPVPVIVTPVRLLAAGAAVLWVLSRDQEERLYRFLFNSLSDAVFLAPLTPEGVHGNFIEVNDAACARLGYTREEFHALNARLLNPPANRDRTRFFGRSIRREGDTIFETLHIAKDGSAVPVEVIARAVVIGGQDYVLSTARDLRAVRRLEAAETRFGKLIDYSWEEIYVISSEDLRFVQVNQGVLDNLGYSRPELEAMRLADITAHGNEAELRRRLAPLHDGSQSRIIIESEHRRKDGSTYPVEVRVQLSHSEQPPVYLANVQDISHRRKAEQRLTYLANYDALTGLPNRGLFLERLQRAVTSAIRHETLVALMFIDLDGFKAVNDSFGHHTGDQLLQQVASRLRAQVRDVDVVARLAGDEFTVVLSSLRAVQDAERIAQKLLDLIQQPMLLNQEEVRVTASVGITIFPFSEGTDVHGLLKEADRAMYEAKQTGKNRYQFYAANLASAESRRATLEHELRLALHRAEFKVHFQPRLVLADGSVAGVEALLRWEHPGLGAISPAEFVPILESIGLIREVGAWVFTEACAQLQPELSRGTLRLSVNVSARQFDDGRLSATIQKVLSDIGVPGTSLEIEITEGVLVSRSSEAAASLNELKQMGVTISLDDFGSGYSSLGYLKQFPIDYLKIDRTFITDLPDRPESCAIVAAIIGLARSLNLKVTAEGIETEEQLAFLRAQGCLEGQGFLFARPMPYRELTRYLSGPRPRH